MLGRLLKSKFIKESFLLKKFNWKTVANSISSNMRKY